MSKYVYLYTGGGMAQTPEAQEQVMQAWTAWFGDLGAAIVEPGNPFGASASVAADGSVGSGSSSGIGGYTVINADSLDDPQKIQQFQAAQGELGSALSRLMVVSENYPELKANGLFQNLQAQLESTENRVTVARNRYVQAVQQYNGMIRTFPNNLTAKMFGYKVKPNFSVDNEKAISTAPTVDFGTTAPAPAATR